MVRRSDIHIGDCSESTRKGAAMTGALSPTLTSQDLTCCRAAYRSRIPPWGASGGGRCWPAVGGDGRERVEREGADAGLWRLLSSALRSGLCSLPASPCLISGVFPAFEVLHQARKEDLAEARKGSSGFR